MAVIRMSIDTRELRQLSADLTRLANLLERRHGWTLLHFSAVHGDWAPWNMCVASGSLLAALSFELFPDAFERGGAWRAGLGLLAGGAIAGWRAPCGGLRRRSRHHITRVAAVERRRRRLRPTSRESRRPDGPAGRAARPRHHRAP